jgi:glutaredoxin 3
MTNKQVAIFTTPTCGYCGMAKEYFKENNISYDEYDVAVDADKRKEMFDKTHQMGVPVIQVGDEYVVGFDQGKLEELLNI